MIDFKMPSLGADMDSGTLTEWRVKPGDHVKRGDIIADVETQKGVIEVEVWDTGVVAEIMVPAGQEVPVGTVLAHIRGDDELEGQPASEVSDVSAAVQKPTTAKTASLAISPTVTTGPVRDRRLRVSPVARRLAHERGVDLALVEGTGPHGTITREDVEKAIQAAPPAPVADDQHIRTSAMRAAIAASMSRSKREIPHYYLQTTVNLEAALQRLDVLNAERSVQDRILPAALYVKATALACRAVPEMNGFWIDGEFHAASSVHVGMAISLRQGGLVAPAIHDAQDRSVQEIMEKLLDLVGRARSGKLKGSEVSDPTITITNMGDQGVATIFGVIYPPQVALVGFGRITARPWVAEEELQVVRGVNLTLSADHRASDGHRGGIFLNTLGNLLADPQKLFV